MQSQNISRRKALTGAGAVAGSTLVAAPAMADYADFELKKLWAKYLVAFREQEEARVACLKLKQRIDVDLGPRPPALDHVGLEQDERGEFRYAAALNNWDKNDTYISWAEPIKASNLVEARKVAKNKYGSEYDAYDKARSDKKNTPEYRAASDLWNRRSLKVDRLAKRIQTIKAMTVFGIGVQLAVALNPDTLDGDVEVLEYEKAQALDVALRSVREATGFDLVAMLEGAA